MHHSSPCVAVLVLRFLQPCVPVHVSLAVMEKKSTIKYPMIKLNLCCIQIKIQFVPQRECSLLTS